MTKLVKGLSHVAPHVKVLQLKDEDFSRDPQAVHAMNEDPLIADEAQPSSTVAELVGLVLERVDRCDHAAGAMPEQDSGTPG